MKPVLQLAEGVFLNANVLAYGLAALAYFFIILHYAGPPFRDWRMRRNRRIAVRKRITVIVDHKRHCRRCFWRSLVLNSSELRLHGQWKYVSIGDEIDKGRNPMTQLFSASENNVVVFNWDSLNGDPVYDSKRTFDVIRHYGPDMKAWLEAGGIVLVESQGQSWDPISEPYTMFDNLVKGPVLVVDQDSKASQKLTIDPHLMLCPMFSSIKPEDLTLPKDSLGEQMDWFPSTEKGPVSIGESRRRPRRLTRGHFQNCGSWQVLLRDGAGNPVAVYHTVPGKNGISGCIILTTLFMASASLSNLIYSLLIDLHGEVDQLPVSGSAVDQNDARIKEVDSNKTDRRNMAA